MYESLVVVGLSKSVDAFRFVVLYCIVV